MSTHNIYKKHVGTHQKRFNKALLMSTPQHMFYEELEKIIAELSNTPP